MKKPGDLVARVGVALVGIPVILGSLWAGGWLFGALLAISAAIGAQEFYRMAEARGEAPFSVLGGALSGALVLAATAWPTPAGFGPVAVGLLLFATGATCAAALVRRWPGGAPTAAVSSTLTGMVYVGLPLSFVPLLRALPELAVATPGVSASGPATALWISGSELAPATAMAFVLLPLLTTWAGDSAAYFVGHAVGRTKLAPTISPGKTIEGSIGGLMGATGAAVLVTLWWIRPHPTLDLSLGYAALVGTTVGVVTQIGDLVESLLKREAGIKDSGSLFPGHGGMLDRLDALLWAFPTTWFLLWMVGVAG